MTDRLAKNERLGKGHHIESRLYAHGHAALFDGVHHGEGVHHRRQHPHMIGGGAFHFRALTTTPEIASADDQAYFHAHVVDFHNLIDDGCDDVLIEAEALFSRQRLSRKFQKDSLVLGLHISTFLRLSTAKRTAPIDRKSIKRVFRCAAPDLFSPSPFPDGTFSIFSIIAYFTKESYIKSKKSRLIFGDFCSFYFQIFN